MASSHTSIDHMNQIREAAYSLPYLRGGPLARCIHCNSALVSYAVDIGCLRIYACRIHSHKEKGLR